MPGLRVGWARLVGYRVCGLTGQTYRRTKTRFHRHNLAEHKATSHGIAATLLDQTVYARDVAAAQHAGNEQATTSQRTTNDSQE